MTGCSPSRSGGPGSRWRCRTCRSWSIPASSSSIETTWGDYLHVVGGRADWADILDRRGVTLVAVSAADEQLVPFIDEHPGWELLHRDDESVLYRRVGPSPVAPGLSE